MSVSGKARVVEFRRRRKEQAVEYMGGKCANCGYSRCVQALEFHHINPSEKDFTISGKTVSTEVLKQELDKCVMLCSNCHKEVHAGLFEAVLTARSTGSLVPKKAKAERLCLDCGVSVTRHAVRCRPCGQRGCERISWPETTMLAAMVAEKGYSATGRALGVSNTAVRDRLRGEARRSAALT
jgi:hypothetical protein